MQSSFFTMPKWRLECILSSCMHCEMTCSIARECLMSTFITPRRRPILKPGRNYKCSLLLKLLRVASSIFHQTQYFPVMGISQAIGPLTTRRHALAPLHSWDFYPLPREPAEHREQPFLKRQMQPDSGCLTLSLGHTGGLQKMPSKSY